MNANAKTILGELAAALKTYIQLRNFTIGVSDVKALLEMIKKHSTRHGVGGYVETSFTFSGEGPIKKISLQLFTHGRAIELA